MRVPATNRLLKFLRFQLNDLLQFPAIAAPFADGCPPKAMSFSSQGTAVFIETARGHAGRVTTSGRDKRVHMWLELRTLYHVLRRMWEKKKRQKKKRSFLGAD